MASHLNVIFRKGVPGDAPVAADLISQAIHSEKMQAYLFGLGSFGKSMQYLGAFFQVPNTRFSHNYATLALSGKEILGIYIGYPGYKGFETSLNLGKAMIRVYGLLGTVKFAIRARSLIVNIPPPEKDHFYVETLAVCEKYRGLGIGKKLLLEAEREAYTLSASFCALDVGLDNEKAREFYGHMGYEPYATFRTEGLDRVLDFKGLMRMVKRVP